MILWFNKQIIKWLAFFRRFEVPANLMKVYSTRNLLVYSIPHVLFISFTLITKIQYISDSISIYDPPPPLSVSPTRKHNNFYFTLWPAPWVKSFLTFIKDHQVALACCFHLPFETCLLNFFPISSLFSICLKIYEKILLRNFFLVYFDKITYMSFIY